MVSGQSRSFGQWYRKQLSSPPLRLFPLNTAMLHLTPAQNTETAMISRRGRDDGRTTSGRSPGGTGWEQQASTHSCSVVTDREAAATPAMASAALALTVAFWCCREKQRSGWERT